jgi:benzaldehyde dehydrogenase (NAD)
VSLLDPRAWTGQIFIGGWTVGGGDDIAVREPATGQQLGTLGSASAEDVVRAAAEAAKAQQEWAGQRPSERAAVLRRAAALWIEHADEIQLWDMRESGSVRAKAAGEVSGAADACFAAAALPSYPHGSVLPSDEARWSFARRRPAGVVSVIAPFNFPLYLAMRSVAPALALGNAVLLKPDPRTSICGGVAIIRIFEAAGLPTGLLQLLPGRAAVGEAVVTAPEVHVVSFTGSTGAGRKVAELAGRHLKRVHLELGGNNALVILPGADVDLAASAGAFGSFAHQGQICMATGRHLVHESLHGAYVDALTQRAANLTVGNPTLNDVSLGPIIDEGQLAHIDMLVQDAVSAGATVAAGGTFEELYYRPTVLADVRSSMGIYREEVFGPVAPVVPFADVDEAIALAATSSYGLSLGILGDVGQAMRIADAVPSGLVHINEQTVADEINVPFGGVGSSGNGSRIGGLDANLEAFTESQWLTVRGDVARYGL